MSIKSALLSAATVGLAAGAALSTSTLAQGAKSGEEKCWGVNSCKGTAKCGVGKADIEATKAAFGEKFAASKTHDCAGSNECGASSGQLNWVSVPNGSCLTKKGFLIVDKGGRKSVVQK